MFLKDSIMLPVHFTDDNERCHIFLSLGVLGRVLPNIPRTQEPKNPRKDQAKASKKDDILSGILFVVRQNAISE